MHITYNKEYMKYVEKCEINVTVRNSQNMKCNLKGSVNRKMQVKENVKLTNVMYIPQSVKNLLSVSRLISKVTTIGDNQENLP